MARTGADIVAALPVAERIRLVSGRDVWHTRPVPGAAVPSMMMTDGPHGLRRQGDGDDHLGATGSDPATCFPTAAALASSWDPGLVREVGAAIGREAAAAGVGLVLGPGMNIKRHPFCGRNFEYLSEDPLLTGRLAAAMVDGIQSTGVGACVKHFAVNNQESHRLVVDAVVDERTLRELYLRGFEIAVRDSQPWAVMSSYNRVNGEYVGESRRLLTDILRAEWGFAGIVISDWGATNDRVAALRAGLDLEMPASHGLSADDIAAAVRTAALPLADLDASAARVVDLALRPPPPRVHVDLDDHHRLARRAAAESSVLLRNDGLLPLTAGPGAPLTVALVGAFAVTPRYQGAGSSLVNPTRLDTALGALRDRPGVTVRYAPGYDPIAPRPDRALVHEAARVARGADVAVVLVGLPPALEAEGFDRDHLALPAQHDALVEAVCAANERTVVALANGSPVAMPWVGRPAAILESYLGGQAGGSALIDVLFGDVEPSGRLAETFPLAATDVPSDPYFPGAPDQVQYREGLFVGYRYYNTAGTEVLFPFGHGLSYTTFEYADLGADAVAVEVTIANSGGCAGTEVVQVYAARGGEPARGPAQVLAGFAKVRVEPGERQRVRVPLDPRAFEWFDRESGAWRRWGGRFEIRVGSSARDVRLRAEVDVDGEPDGPPPAPPGLVADADADFAAVLGRPVPRWDPPAGFTRTSTIGELRRTRTGRALRAALLRVIAPPLRALAAGDRSLEVRFVRAADEVPLRQIAQFSDGRVSWGLLDAVIEVLNGRPGGVARRVARGRESAPLGGWVGGRRG